MRQPTSGEYRGSPLRTDPEDTAFLFFRAWELPVDTRLYVTSAAFGGKHVWERGTPLG